MSSFGKCLDGQDLEAFRNPPATWDARLLPVVKSASGTPRRMLSSPVMDCKQEKMGWISWVPGGVIAEWCFGYLDVQGLVFEGPSGSRWSIEEQGIFGGIKRAASSPMVGPAVLDFVQTEVTKVTQLYKALRLARKEKTDTTAKRGNNGGRGKKEEE